MIGLLSLFLPAFLSSSFYFPFFFTSICIYLLLCFVFFFLTKSVWSPVPAGVSGLFVTWGVVSPLTHKYTPIGDTRRRSWGTSAGRRLRPATAGTWGRASSQPWLLISAAGFTEGARLPSAHESPSQGASARCGGRGTGFPLLCPIDCLPWDRGRRLHPEAKPPPSPNPSLCL